MSELFIRQLAFRVTRHPEFQRAMETAVSSVLQTVLTEDYAGERFNLYAAKRPASMRRERDQIIRAQYTAGKTCEQLAHIHRISVRHISRIVAGCKHG